jgi:hypothetical protein
MLRLSPSGPFVPDGNAPRLFFVDIGGGPNVPPSSIADFMYQTDSFNFADVGELLWSATVPVGPSPTRQAIVSVRLGPGTFPGATCSIFISAQNLDPLLADVTGPFRLLLALFASVGLPTNQVPP